MSLKQHSSFFILAISHITLYDVKGVPYHDTPVLICGYINSRMVYKHDIVLQWLRLTCSFISVFHLLQNVNLATVEKVLLLTQMLHS